MSTLRRNGGVCLLVIDLQVDVVAPCSDVDGVLSRTAAVIDRARLANVPVIFVRHQEEDLPPGTPGWQLAVQIVPQPGEVLIDKRYRDAFADTPLADELAQLGVTRVLVAGAQSDYCVRATMQRAAGEGYDVTLLRDCHTTEDGEFDGVKITAEQIVAHTNRYMSRWRYPGQTIGIAAHDAPELFG